MGHCCGVDHHRTEYTPAQRADLELVQAFNRRLAAAIEDCRDVAPVEALLDPDPLRYMWVDEGGGRLAEFLARGEQTLTQAPVLPGHRRLPATEVTDSGMAVRPAVAVAPDGTRLFVWLEWVAGQGERLLARLEPPAGPATGTPDSPPAQSSEPAQPTEPIQLSPAPGEPPADHFRPTAGFDRHGRGWVSWSRSDGGQVAIWCRRLVDGAWTDEERVSGSGHPSFNQELAVHDDGEVELCWQGPNGAGFGIVSRSWRDGSWAEPHLVSDGVDGNVWDPAVVALAGGGSAYAWAEYLNGSYRVCLRRKDSDGALGEVRALTGGTDYALHPSLAVTADGRLWCAFDVLSVHGHGGSGPTRLRPAERVGEPVWPEEMRPGGAAIPPELLPRVEAGIRVVRVDEDGLFEPAGTLAEALDVTPSGMPRLVADPAGGLTVAYRIHRRLPLMTYFWEVAAQTLTEQGWSAPVTFAASDATLEEPAVAALPTGALIAWQSDDRRERGLSWTEGFGGRECPYLLEHQGEVVWHGMHGTGQVRCGTVDSGPLTGVAGRTLPLAEASARREARAWVGPAAERGERYRTEVDGQELSLYWGDLHRHSLTSRCTAGDEPSLEDFYRYSWDVCEYDFWAVTDHSENSSDYQWWSIQKIADLFRVDGRFVPLYGFEWTGDTGHQNVIYGDVGRGAPIFSAYADGSLTPAELWAQLRRQDLPVLTIPHHPGSAMVPMDWDYYDGDLMRLVEVFQACRGNYEDDGCFRQYSDGILSGTFTLDGLRRGHKFGLIASSDHGHGAAYVGAFANGLDRASVFEALHARRTFAATTRDLMVDARIAGAFMGGTATVAGSAPVRVQALVRGFGELARVDVLRDGAVVHSVEAESLPTASSSAGTVRVPLRVEWGGSLVPTDWTGGLEISAGEIVQTSFWSPEVTSVSPSGVTWEAQTTSFGEVYGSQRGGIELTLVGPPDAVVRVKTAQGGRELPLGELVGAVQEIDALHGFLRLQPGVGGLVGLGVGELRLDWTDPRAEGDAWYYLRAIQTDGEMVWSSPVWVERDRA
jgi:hypothetical protein